jgi:DUF1680 family protein
MTAHPAVEEARGRIAVLRGPLVYCLEEADLPPGVPMHEVHIPRDVRFEASHEPGLLGGVTVLEGEVCRRRAPEWRGRLYAELPETACERVRVRLIPYYAWLNRGPGEMQVWLPPA